MNKKIKVIELLNIVASGKDIPKKIKVFINEKGEHVTDIYKFNEYDFYENDKEDSLVENWLNNTMKLNEEVEIIEDEIDIQNLEELTYKGEEIGLGTTEKIDDDIDDCCTVLYNCLDMCGIKINELVKAIKQLDKKINKED